MKIIKYILAFMLMFMMACEEKFLEKEPENTLPTEEVDFTKIEDMYAPVSGMYAVARRRFSQWEIWPMINIRGDEVTKGGGSEADQFQYLQVERFEYGAIKNYWALNNTWNAFYNVVYTSFQNMELLENYRRNIVDDDDLQRSIQYEAEIRFLRAFAYFLIHNLWGEVPIVDGNDLWKADIPRRTIPSVRAYINEELDFCIANLPPNIRPNERTDFPGAVTKFTAQALKAKLALYEENYTLARDLTDEIINSGKFSLYPDFYELFKISSKLNDESLYELQFTDFGEGAGDQISGGAWFAHQGPRDGTPPISGWGFNEMEQGFVDFMTARGEVDRFDGALLTLGATTRSGDDIPPFNLYDYLNGKAYTPSNQMTPGRTNYGANNNIRVMRYADVLLINAEAKLQAGGDAATPFNEVRARAGMAAITNPTLDEILDERRAEFSVEWGDRYYDLVRTGRAQGTLPGFRAGEHEYLPIPLSQEDLNPKLKEEAVD